jgi:hypothetical protein
MGQWIGTGMGAFILLLFLSVASVIALGVCWIFVAPESEDGEITTGGRAIRRAQYSLTAACGLIFICLLLDLFVRGPASSMIDVWIWGGHPRVLVLSLILSSGLSVAASFFAFQSKGDGRWVLWTGAPMMAALSLIVATCIDQLI